MHRAAIADDLPVNSGLGHLGFKGSDMLDRDKGVIRTVAHQDLCLDFARLCRTLRFQGAVE